MRTEQYGRHQMIDIAAGLSPVDFPKAFVMAQPAELLPNDSALIGTTAICEPDIQLRPVFDDHHCIGKDSFSDLLFAAGRRGLAQYRSFLPVQRCGEFAGVTSS